MTIDRLLLLPVGSCFGKGWEDKRWMERGVRDLIRKILKKVWPRGLSPRGSRSPGSESESRAPEGEAGGRAGAGGGGAGLVLDN